MRLAYADPPYIGCAHLYKDHADFGGEVDHTALIQRLESEFDGWVLHAAATPRSMAVLAPLVEKTGARWMSWVKSFAAFKRNVSVALWMAFSASVIKCGDPWTPTCQEMWTEACAGYQVLAKAVQP